MASEAKKSGPKMQSRIKIKGNLTVKKSDNQKGESK